MDARIHVGSRCFGRYKLPSIKFSYRQATAFLVVVNFTSTRRRSARVQVQCASTASPVVRRNPISGKVESVGPGNHLTPD
jgi:hypothetical protein